jgi:hypothetical protein
MIHCCEMYSIEGFCLGFRKRFEGGRVFGSRKVVVAR